MAESRSSQSPVEAQRTSPGISFFTSMFAIVCVTMLLHELVHWLTGTALGYDMYFTLTTAGVVDGGWRSDLDYAIVSIAGPMFTVVMGIAGTWLAVRHRKALGYELVFAACMQRFVAMLLSGIFIPNDEARVSLFLGWPWWLLPAMVVLLLLVLTVLASRALRYGWLIHLGSYVTASLAFTLMVFADGKLAGAEGPSIVDPLLPEGARWQDVT